MQQLSLKTLGIVAAAIVGTLGASASTMAAFIPGTTVQPTAWFDADAITPVADGTSVGTWADKSGNGKNATSAAARNPAYYANVANGHAALRFNVGGTNNAANEYLAFVGLIGNSATSNVSIFVVANDTGTKTSLASVPDADERGPLVNTRQSPATAGGFVLGYLGQGNATTAGYSHIGGSSTEQGTLQRASIAEDNFNLIRLNRTGLTSELATYADAGRSSNTVTWNNATPFATSAATTTQIGAEGGGTGAYFFGDISEIIIVDGALSDADRYAITTYLGDKYAITAALPEPTAIAALSVGAFLFRRRRTA